MRRQLAAILLVGFFFCGSADADLNASLEVSGDSLRIGDELEMQLEVEMPTEGQLLLPDWQKALDPFELLAPPDTSVFQVSDNHRQLQLHLRTTCYSAGAQVVQPLELRWISDDGTVVDSTETEPQVVLVQGVIPDSILAMADTSSQPYHFLQPNRRLKLSYSFAEVAFWIFIALAAAGVTVLVWWLLHRRKRVIEEAEIGPPQRPAHEIALEELDKLRDKRLYQAGHVKLYYSGLSDIIRRYFEARYEVPAMESTSFQLLRDMETHLTDQNLVSVLGTLLTDADLAKFAKHQPDAQTCQRDLENAYVLVNKTKPKPKPLLTEEAA